MLAAEHVGGHPFRTKTLILIAYRHALRVSELAALRWDQVDLKQGHLHVRKAKNGVDSTHPLHGTELRALKRLEREHERMSICIRDRAWRSVDNLSGAQTRDAGR